MDSRLVFLLNSILGTHKVYSQNEYYFTCPFCHHPNPKLAVNLAKGAWHCWTCQARGRVVGLLRKVNAPQEIIREVAGLIDDTLPVAIETNEAPPVLPEEYISLHRHSTLIEYRKATGYLRDRHISPIDMVKYQLGYCVEGPYAHRIIIPSFSEVGTLNYFVARDYYGGSPMKYKNPKSSKNVVGFENQINWAYPIVLCEGAFDAMAIRRNAIPLFGKSLPSNLYRKIILEGVDTIYLALDRDARRDAIRIAETLIREGISVYMVELSGKDPSEIGTAGMARLIAEARPISFTELVQLQLSVI